MKDSDWFIAMIFGRASINDSLGGVDDIGSLKQIRIMLNFVKFTLKHDSKIN